jgi:hypothetical protein
VLINKYYGYFITRVVFPCIIFVLMNLVGSFKMGFFPHRGVVVSRVIWFTNSQFWVKEVLSVQSHWCHGKCVCVLDVDFFPFVLNILLPISLQIQNILNFVFNHTSFIIPLVSENVWSTDNYVWFTRSGNQVI